MSRIDLQQVGVVGATGPTGRALVEALRQRSTSVRALSRSTENLQLCFPHDSVEKREGDALDAHSLAPAVSGCDLIVNCIGLGPEQMHLHPEAARNVTLAAAEQEARILHVSSFWAYLPLTAEVLDELHPRDGGPPWVRFRREAEDIHQQAGGAVVHLPDFFGPHVHTSTLQQAIEGALQSGVVNWIGAADVVRECAFVPDAMRIVSELAVREEAYGERWIIPGAGPLTARRLGELLERMLQKPIRLRTAGPLMLRVLSWFKSDLRGFMPMVPDYVKPIRYDASKLRRLLGELPVAGYEEAVAATIEWLRGRTE